MDPFIGEIRAFAFSFVPKEWAVCDGSILPIRLNTALFNVLGNKFGGDGGTTFGLPDLRGRAVVAAGAGVGLSPYKPGTMVGQEMVTLTLAQMNAHTHSPTGTVLVNPVEGTKSSPAGTYLANSPSAQYGEKSLGYDMALGSVKGEGASMGGNQGHENRQPFLVMTYAVALSGVTKFSDAYTGDIRVFGGNTPPDGWRLCDGSLLSISEYQALYTAIGTTYGGDGQTTFALPNLASRVVVGQGQGQGLSSYSMGEKQGTETVTLLGQHTPAHQHAITGTVNVITGTTTPNVNPTQAYFSDKGVAAYSPTVGTGALAENSLSGTMQPAGGKGLSGEADPHTNVQPVTAIYHIICLEGVFPNSPS